MKYILNIGLEGDIYGEVITQLNNLRGKWFDNYHITEQMGEYNGTPEQTAVITLDSKAHYSSIEIMTKKLCKSLKQECISFAIIDKHDNMFGSLIYNNDYLGKQQTFNRNYFITKH
jgi:hypothetical protein